LSDAAATHKVEPPAQDNHYEDQAKTERTNSMLSPPGVTEEEGEGELNEELYESLMQSINQIWLDFDIEQGVID